jgi:hypothetical protein
MITNTGKSIIAKYLIGTAPAYASYIALGCGAKPRPSISQITGASSVSTTVTCASTSGLWIGALCYQVTSGTGSIPEGTTVTAILSTTQFTLSNAPTIALSASTVLIEVNPSKQVLDFEMFRVPIASRGYVNDNGINKIVLTGELPTEERYEITEIGIFSAGANADAGSYDSKTITAFADTENWQFVDGLTVTNPTLITTSLVDVSNVITTGANSIQTTANNAAFSNTTRAARYETCRYFNNILMLRGNTSNISSLGTIITSGSITPKILQLTGQGVDLTKNSTSDLLKVAFSLINKDGSSPLVPDSARVILEFANSDSTQYARMFAEVNNSTYNFASNRYFTISKRLDELSYYTSDPTNPFSWNNVSVIKVYASTSRILTINNKEASTSYVTLTTFSPHNLVAGDVVYVDGIDSRCNGLFTIYDTPSPNTFRYYNPGTTLGSTAVSPTVNIESYVSTYFIALDAIRIDNISTVNPLYGMTGYSIIQNDSATSIVKASNTNNYVEFRYILDVT